eukprot:scaffold167677_cov30-Tisochrysis_lutea.AAC.2
MSRQVRSLASDHSDGRGSVAPGYTDECFASTWADCSSMAIQRPVVMKVPSPTVGTLFAQVLQASRLNRP